MDSGPLYMAMNMRDIDMFRLHLPNLHRINGFNNTQDIHDTVLKVANWCYNNYFDHGLLACLEAGMSPDLTDEAGENTILALAAKCSRNNIISLLLSQGADADALSVYGRSALLEASIVNNIDGINLLANSGCNLDIKDPAQFTPLLNAIADGSTTACLRLIELGADLTPPPSFSFSSLGDFARAMGHEKCAKAVETAIATKCAEELKDATCAVGRSATRRTL